VRRYGFHGTSHRYVSARCRRDAGQAESELKLISCHLGNGSSITAPVDGGKSVDTSMGFTPLAGLPMGTRSGDLDAGHPPVHDEQVQSGHRRDAEHPQQEVRRAGHLRRQSSDFRDLEPPPTEGNERARLALDMFYYGSARIIGAYAAAMGGVDAIIFTAGVGENSASQRLAIASDLEFMGVKMDADANNVRGKEAIISAVDSRVKVLLIPTNEELMIAMDTAALAK
jgi:acetate kinase